ncbi:MAG: pseudouridine-5'-phosphate glycosidase [Anaerolineales bacterium]
MSSARLIPPRNVQWLHLKPQVAEALREGEPVVALESTVLTHGLPRPVNLELARYAEAAIRSGAATPATIAIYKGAVKVGLSDVELERLALDPDAVKVSRRDLAIAANGVLNGGTTVAATMYIAHAAGIKVFATGGIGGVHRGDSGDISADLPELRQTPVTVVCAGAKSILDLPRTLEWLETGGIPVLGWQTDTFPAFFSRSSGLPIHKRVDTIGEAAAIILKHRDMGLQSGILLCVPCPEDTAVPFDKAEALIEEAERAAERASIHGKDLTPFLLDYLSEKTDGATLQSNLALLQQNARIGAELAAAIEDQRG